MAFVDNQQSDDKNKPGTPTPGTTTGGPSASPVGSQASAGRPGTSFATLDKYLAPNQEQAAQLAGNIVNTVQTLPEETKSSVDTAKTAVSGQIESGAKTLASPEVFEKAKKSPISELTPEDQAAWEKQKGLLYGYQGPTSPTTTPEFTKAQSDVAKAKEIGNLTQSEAGRKQLVEQQQTNKAPGLTSFNQALVSIVPGAKEKIEAIKPSFDVLDQYLTGAGTELQAKQAEAEARTKAAQEGVKGYEQNLVNELTTGAEGVRAGYQGGYDKAARALTTGNVTDEDLASLGVSKNTWTELQKNINALKVNFGVDFPIDKYLQKPNLEEITPQSFATKEDYEYYKALEELLGNTPSLLTNAEIAGTTGTGMRRFEPALDVSSAQRDLSALWSQLSSQAGQGNPPLPGNVPVLKVLPQFNPENYR